MGRRGLPMYLDGSRPIVVEALRENALRFPRLVVVWVQPWQFGRVSGDDEKPLSCFSRKWDS